MRYVWCGESDKTQRSEFCAACGQPLADHSEAAHERARKAVK